MWNTIDGEDHYSLEGTKQAIEDQLPEELNECFGITEYMDDEPEELSSWINEGVAARENAKKVLHDV